MVERLKKSDGLFTTNDLYRVPAFFMQLAGMFFGYKIMITGLTGGCKEVKPDLQIYGNSVRSDYFFAVSLIAIGSIVLFIPILVKTWKAFKK